MQVHTINNQLLYYVNLPATGAILIPSLAFTLEFNISYTANGH